MAISPDGKLLAAGSAFGDAYLWDIAGNKLRPKLSPAPGQELSSALAAFALAFSPDGKRLAAGTMRKVVVWTAATGKVERALKPAGTQDADWFGDLKFS